MTGQVTGHIKSHGITAGTEGLGIFGVTANRTYLPVSVPSRFTLLQNKEISETLDDARDVNMMIYDTGEKIAHVLPQVDVVLFVARHIVKRRKYDSVKSGQALTLDFASKNVPAFDILQNSLNVEIIRRGSPKKAGTKVFGDLVKEIWNSLDTIENALVANERVSAAIDKGAPKFLYGVEFRDFECTKSSMNIVHAEVDQPWVHLMNSEPTMPVLFCRGLGQPIVPTDPAFLCKRWKKVPSGRYYMVVTCSTVFSWLERHKDDGNGARLDERVEWRVRQNVLQEGLIHCHKHKESKMVYHEQQLSFAAKARFNPNIQELVINCGSGGLIFGSSKLQKGCSTKLDLSTGTPSQAPVPLTTQYHTDYLSSSSNGPMPDIPEGSSDTSVENETSSAMDHLSSPLSLSVSNSSQGNHDPQAIDNTPSLVGNTATSPLCQAEYVVESVAESTGQDKFDGAPNSIPRSLKKMKKSVHLNALHREENLEIE